MSAAITSSSGLPVPQPGALRDRLDIVISTSKDDLTPFLERWRTYLQPYHLIIIRDGPEPSRRPIVPAGYDFELFTRVDIQRLLGGNAWCISARGAASRCFGFLVSRKRYVLTLEDDVAIVKDPRGKDVDPLQQHITNLLTPSTPYFFNTLYDPYREGTDFVRGYPFSLREGVPTVASHGLALGAPEGVAATQTEVTKGAADRNGRYVDCVLTVPRGVHFPMSSVNLAFDRALLGPAMYFGVFEGTQSADWCHDLFAGYCCKVICDHLGLGMKTGLPYVSRPGGPSRIASQQQQQDPSGASLQEALVPFFSTVTVSQDCASVADSYLEIAQQVRTRLAPLDPAFVRLADAMTAWVDCWKQLNPTLQL